jgi:small subunit ribosomal protein S19e
VRAEQFTPWIDMVRVYDVPANRLIEALAEHLKRVTEVEPPQWAPFVKTGSHAERPPQHADWWYTRAASLMRKVYMRGPVGMQELESAYGGSKALAYFPKHHRNAGGSIIRNVLKQLEQAELVTKQGTKGRVLTPRGVALLDKVSKDVFKELVKETPVLARYG